MPLVLEKGSKLFPLKQKVTKQCWVLLLFNSAERKQIVYLASILSFFASGKREKRSECKNYLTFVAVVVVVAAVAVDVVCLKCFRISPSSPSKKMPYHQIKLDSFGKGARH